jgi:hypothetical protein
LKYSSRGMSVASSPFICIRTAEKLTP